MNMPTQEEMANAIGIMVYRVANLESELKNRIANLEFSLHSLIEGHNTLVESHNALQGRLKGQEGDFSAAIIALQKESFGIKGKLGVPLTVTLWTPEVEKEMENERKESQAEETGGAGGVDEAPLGERAEAGPTQGPEQQPPISDAQGTAQDLSEPEEGVTHAD